MTAIRFLLQRYLFPKGGSLLTLALWVSVAGVALGVAQLLLVLSVMSGFLGLLQEKYTDITSEMVILPRGDKLTHPKFRKAIESLPGVQAISPFGLGQAMVLKDGVGGVTLEGISVEESSKVTPWERVWVEPPLEELQKNHRNWIWLGKGLADKLRAKPGDTVQVRVPDRNDERENFIVTGIVKFGIYEHDLRYAYLDLGVLHSLFGRTGFEPFYKVRLKKGENLQAVADLARSELGKSATVRLWSDINQNIFLAVRHQKKLLFLVLDIVVALAGLNVINLLMMSANQRKRDIAILRAMGMRYRGVIAFFVAQGAAVGLVGTGAGVVLGYIACFLAEKFQPELLSEAIYNVTRLPFKTELADVALVSLVAFSLCVLFSVLPALRAASQRPVEALRYE